MTDRELRDESLYTLYNTPGTINGNVPIPYDRLSPKSINHVLAHEGTSEYNQFDIVDFSGTWQINETDTAIFTVVKKIPSGMFWKIVSGAQQ